MKKKARLAPINFGRWFGPLSALRKFPCRPCRVGFDSLGELNAHQRDAHGVKMATTKAELERGAGA